MYRNPSLSLPVRMRAAMACLPFELPKLAVTAVVTEHDFATLLDQRIENMNRIRNGNGIEASLCRRLKPPKPKHHTPDRRFRRI